MAAQPTMNLRRPPIYCATKFLQLPSLTPANFLYCHRSYLRDPEDPEDEQRQFSANFTLIKQLQIISITLETKSYTRRG
jgi:hypothetical protein